MVDATQRFLRVNAGKSGPHRALNSSEVQELVMGLGWGTMK